jgi:hypothetical protein
MLCLWVQAAFLFLTVALASIIPAPSSLLAEDITTVAGTSGSYPQTIVTESGCTHETQVLIMSQSTFIFRLSHSVRTVQTPPTMAWCVSPYVHLPPSCRCSCL